MSENQYHPESFTHPGITLKEKLMDSLKVVGKSKLNRQRIIGKFGIDVITWVYNVGHKNKISDGQSCFRAYNRRLLEDVEIDSSDKQADMNAAGDSDDEVSVVAEMSQSIAELLGHKLDNEDEGDN